MNWDADGNNKKSQEMCDQYYSFFKLCAQTLKIDAFQFQISPKTTNTGWYGIVLGRHERTMAGHDSVTSFSNDKDTFEK